MSRLDIYQILSQIDSQSKDLRANAPWVTKSTFMSKSYFQVGVQIHDLPTNGVLQLNEYSNVAGFMLHHPCP